MDDFKGSESFTSFKELSGISVQIEDVVNEVSKLPLDGILGFMGGLSVELIQHKEKFFSPQLQGKYLQYAIVDDFPQKIPAAYKMYIPGRVPITGGRHIFVHEQNLAWLCHAALLHSKEDLNTPEITHDLQCRLFRILLIINDLLSTEQIGKPYDLIKCRTFSHNWLRHGQFNRFFGHSIEILIKLARQKILLLEILPKYYEEVESNFLKAAGINLQRYFEILALFVTHFYEGMAKGEHWLSKDTICSQIKANKEDIERTLDYWSRTPGQYRLSCQKWRNERSDMGELPVYDFVPLRETPLIEGRPGDLICPVPSFLFSKIEDGPFFILSDFLEGKELKKFHTATGNAYEKYAHKLVERIAKKDYGGEWIVKHSPATKKSGQLTDSYLQRGKVAVVFEHKAKRPGTEFLRGREGDRVIGPSEKILKKLDDNEAVDYKEGHSNDDGFITQGMWQQSKAGPKIISWAEKEIGMRPDRLFPLITHLSSLIVDGIVRKAYLNPLIEQAGLYSDEYWEQPQWLNISNLELLAQMAEDGSLDLEILLNTKASQSVNERFDVFLYESMESRFIDQRLYDEVLSLLDSATVAFFKKELIKKDV